jgi:hypothetical protein
MTEPGAGRRFATPPYCRMDDRICRNRRPFATAASRGAFTRSLVGAAKRGRTLRTPCHAALRVPGTWLGWGERGYGGLGVVTVLGVRRLRKPDRLDLAPHRS